MLQICKLNFSTKLLITSVALVMIMVSSDAQVTFRKTFGLGQRNDAFAITELLDSGFVFTGATDAGYGQNDVYVNRIDKNGNFIKHFTLGSSSIESANGITALPDSGFALCGVSNFNFLNGYDGYMVRCNANGDTIFTKAIGGTGWDFLQAVVYHQNFLYLTGYSYSPNNTNSDAWILKTDLLGNIIWQYYFDFANADDAFKAINISNANELVVGGYTTINELKYAWIKRFNLNGQDLNKNLIINYNNNNNFELTSIASDDDTAIWFTTIITDTSSSEFYSAISKFSYSNDSLNYFEFGNTTPNLSLNSISAHNNRIYAAGMTNQFGSGREDFYLFTTLNDGTQAASNTYGGTEKETAYAIHATRDGGAIVAGNATSYRPGIKSCFIVKCDAQLNSGSLSIGFEEYNKTSCIIYYGNNSINFTKPFNEPTVIQIYSYDGKLIFSQPISGFEQSISLPYQMASGIYTFKYSNSATTQSSLFIVN
ncbi:MAG: hypothetical protein RIQ89_1592 [Bacteroidota bacterium]|jgi:hypothetical protein